jgi:hypothetical protein
MKICSDAIFIMPDNGSLLALPCFLIPLLRSTAPAVEPQNMEPLGLPCYPLLKHLSDFA